MSIKILDSGQSTLIRAGEVIERPASIVKELVENSIDSHADIIHIIYDGKKIIIDDNGKGMSYDDLNLCLEKHATSKIRSFSDLRNLRTLGFRGEGLTSIASIADITVETRENEKGKPLDSNGWKLVSKSSGCKEDTVPTARTQGTRIIVENIFNNVPARLKFMKSTTKEKIAIRNIIDDIALAHPNITFKFTTKETINYPATHNEIDRLKAIYPGNYHEFNAGDDKITIKGFVTDEDISLCVVNGRTIRDKYIRELITEITKDFRRYFGYCFFIEINPDLIDVNVHPRKLEVKFSLDLKPYFDEMLNMLGQPNIAGHRLAEQALINLVKQKPKARIIGQAMNSYIIADTEQGIVIMDQHAAHERIVYEKMKTMIGNVPRRKLSNPVVVKLKNAELIEDIDLENFGLKAWCMDSEHVAVSEIPEILGVFDVEKLIIDLVKSIEKSEIVSSDYINKICSLFACHNAIRFGDELDEEAMGILLGLVEETARSGYCNHGRPTSFLLSPEDLNKLFHR